MKHLSVVIVLLALCAAVRADDGGVIGVGGSVQLMHPEHSSIRMVSEAVRVKLPAEGQPFVHCTFVFKNEGPAATVKMGFPESSGAQAVNPKSKHSYLIGFKSWVDGEPVKTVLVPSSNKREDSFTAWHVKSVQFAAGQTRTIVDTYKGGGGEISDGSQSFNYTLTSGVSWKGKIGEAVITVDTSALLDKYVVTKTTPKGSARHGGMLTWTLRNFEPHENVWIFFEPAVTIMINGNPTPILCDRVNNVSTATAEDLAGNLEHVTQTSKGNTCTMKSRSHILVMTAGSKTARLDGSKTITLPRAPFIVGRTRKGPDMAVPIAAVVRALGGKAQLNGRELKITM